MAIEYDLYIASLFAKAGRKGVPLAGAFELTSRCCLHCRMCYIHRKENDAGAIQSEKDAQWWIDLARKAKDEGMLMLLLTGGEPLLRKDFDEIYIACHEMGLMVSVNTNGVLLDDDKIRLFTQYPPQRLNITLYGTSEETYGELCRNAQAFRRVASSIYKAKKSGINIRINYSVTPYNKADFPKATAFAKEIDVPLVAATYMFPAVRSDGRADRLGPEAAASVHFEWMQRTMSREELCEYAEKLGKQQPSEEGYYNEKGEKIPCRAGSSSFWVTADGIMTPCGMMTKPSAVIGDSRDFDSAWQTIRSEREGIHLPRKCADCNLRQYCDICAAVSNAETGKFSEVPEYACRKAAHYKKLCVELSKK